MPRARDVWRERRSFERAKRRGDFRDPYERDRARITHCAAFRRLQAKTQVLGIGEGDFHRTRLTHSMEVAQVAWGIAGCLQRKGDVMKALRELTPEPVLVEAIGLAHDLGHPPFGHGGEVALNFMMREHGGFEGNGQSLRLAARLEPSTAQCGLDLTRRVLLGILKYPAPYSRMARTTLPEVPPTLKEVRAADWKPPKCYFDDDDDVVDWLLAPFSVADRFQECIPPSAEKAGKAQHESFDTSLMELADDIAYGVHDVEDGLALGMIGRDDWHAARDSFDGAWGRRVGIRSFSWLEKELLAGSWRRKKAIGAMVNAFVVSAVLRRNRGFEHALLRYRVALPEPAHHFLQAMKRLAYERMIKVPTVQTLEYRGQLVVMSLFQALSSDPDRLIPEKSAERVRLARTKREKARAICDYVAGMTDDYAERMYERLFVPGTGSVFARL
ncbi:MAG: dGTPase [Gemmatimonadaceae bacterium]|nr:dGTPase [Gemmatimonadaceae bacterium]